MELSSRPCVFQITTTHSVVTQKDAFLGLRKVLLIHSFLFNAIGKTKNALIFISNPTVHFTAWF